MTKTKSSWRVWPILALALLVAACLMALARPSGAQEVTQVADLSILKFDLPNDAVAVGQPLSYELAVANNGPGDASGVRVTDTLPPNTRFLSFTPGNPGSCANRGNNVTCDLGGLVPNAEVSIFFDACPVSPGTATNTARVAGATIDPNAANNASTETTQVTPGSGGCAAQPGPQPQSNAAPDARNDSYTLRENRSLAVRTPGVLRNDRGADGDRLRARAVTVPGHGRLTLRADGSFVYRPDRNYDGLDSFVYSVSDGKGGTDRARVTLRVRPAPEPGRPDCDGGATVEGSSASTCNATAKDGNASAGDAAVGGRRAADR